MPRDGAAHATPEAARACLAPNVVTPTGFEPKTAIVHTGGAGVPGRGQVTESKGDSSLSEAHSGAGRDRAVDAPERSPWCAFGAQAEVPPDLSRLALIWPTLRDHVRAAIMTLAEKHGCAAETHDSAGQKAWLMLPEKTRASLIESIGNAMKNMIETEEREVKLLQESMEHEVPRIEEQEDATHE